jgi:hypothetical protein
MNEFTDERVHRDHSLGLQLLPRGTSSDVTTAFLTTEEWVLYGNQFGIQESEATMRQYDMDWFRLVGAGRNGALTRPMGKELGCSFETIENVEA